MNKFSGPDELDRITHLLGKLPGLGPRSARRAVLYLLKRRDSLMRPLADHLREAADSIVTCSECGNLDSSNPCSICVDTTRDASSICVVKEVGDVWALERTSVYRGYYHVTGGLLSALDGVRPTDLNINSLVTRAQRPEVTEVILGMDATIDGQTTAHYLIDILTPSGVAISSLARGMPVGGELDYLDDGTIQQAIKARRFV